MTRIRFLFLLGFGLLVVPLSAAEINVTGKWEITTSTQRGERTSEIELVQSGKQLKVTMEGREGNKVEGSGTVTGNNIAWSVTRETPRGEFTMNYHGTVSGDSMEGEVQFGNMGSGKWTATRKAE